MSDEIKMVDAMGEKSAPAPKPADGGKAASVAQDASAPADQPSPRPYEGGAIPDHQPLPDAVIAQRLAPDGARSAAVRPVLSTQPLIGPVEGNIAIPDSTMPAAFPFPKMGVNDSFDVVTGITAADLLASAEQWAKDHSPGTKWEVHELNGRPRIWRVA